MAKLFYLAVGCWIIVFLPAVGAEELPTNPWLKAKNQPHTQADSTVLSAPYEQQVKANIPNTVQYVPHIRRGGAGVISRPLPHPSAEPSFFDGLFADEEKTAEQSSASDNSIASWFADDNTQNSNSTDSIVNDFDNQYNNLANQYNAAKNAVTQTVDGAKQTVEGFTREVKKYIP